MTKLKILILMAVVIATPILAARFLPWWAAAAVLLLDVGAILILAPRLLSQLVQEHMQRIFAARSEVLESAQVRVLEVAPADRPVGAEPQREARFIRVDVEITPQSPEPYEPADLLLLAADAPADFADAPSAHPVRVWELTEDGTQRDAEQFKGAMRLRIVYSVPEALSGPAVFRYYFARFGDLVVP